MTKTQFNSVIRKLDYKLSVYLPPEPGKLTGTQIDRDGTRYTLYSTWPCGRNCIAADISKSYLQYLLVD